MFAEERRNKIISLIKQGLPVKVTELSNYLSVSEATVRRDLQELDAMGLIQRTHGGAVSADLSLELSFQDREICNLEAKRQIASVAAAMVADGETILLDAGTTTREIARALRGKKITVATNSMDIASVFTEDDQIEVLVLGGTWRKTINSLVGPITNTMLKLFRFDKLFLAANAVDPLFGVTTQNLIEAETKRAMLKSAKTAILAVDYSKFNQQNFAKICEIDELNCIISDRNLNKETIDLLQQQTELIVAN